VDVRVNGNFEFGADAIICRDEHGVFISGGFEIEETAEAAKFGVRTGATCRTGERGDGPHQRIAGVDIDTCLCVGIAIRAVFGGCHAEVRILGIEGLFGHKTPQNAPISKRP